MNRRGHRGRVDGNHVAMIDALRKSGINAVSLAPLGNGIPDILCSFRGANYLVECKDGDKPLTKAEIEWHATWSGQVCIARSPEDAVLKVLAAAKEAGKL